ncbi:MAG: hypothetical protein HZB39_00835 [Planctomycetes bacterium]|nr:hypothetical protein [Planctomycetota bacterium]
MSIRVASSIVLLLLAGSAVAQGRTDYGKDLRFAVDELGTQCRELIELKDIDWRKATAPLLAESRKVKTDAEHMVLLQRLLARLHDGHAELRPLEKGKDVRAEWPDRSAGPGLFLCRAQGRLFVKNAWGDAKAAGLEPGMEIVKVDDQPAAKWFERRVTTLCDLLSFSTPQQAFFFACHQGLADAPGTRVAFELRDADGQSKKRTLTWGKANQTPFGPAFPPPGLTSTKDLHFGRTAQGFGYVHVRRCKEDVVAQLDEALATLEGFPGLILDFRGNSGGGFDHDAFFGRFLARGKTWRGGGGEYRSAGDHPYAGPLVVIVDATVRSAGETAAGMFQEDGRAFSIGESATAGMSSQKTTIELPSGLFALYVSIASNKARFQGGKGIEGIGVIPMEIVEFDAADLAQERDTLIARAEALFADWPKEKVRYVPEEMGWAKPGK